MGEESVVDWDDLAAQRVRWVRATWPGRRPGPAQLALNAQNNLAAFTDWCSSEGPPDSKAMTPSAVAMVFFGPSGPPPPELWDAFVTVHCELVASAPADRPPNVFDLMLAFGCGWRRAVHHYQGPWWGRWEVAYAAMINQVRASVVASGHLLANQFPQFALNRDDVMELPGDFTVSLLGSCDCGHHVRACPERRAGVCCFPPHDLRSWDPLKCHLRPFVDQAVRGTATNTILGGAFAESLIFRDLERQGRILRRRVEFRQCECGELFEGRSCPKPGCSAPEGAEVCRVARPNWLILPEHEGGNYREVVRWVCGSCECLYPRRFTLDEVILGDPCSYCGWTPGEGTEPRKITVWVRVPRSGPSRDVQAPTRGRPL